MDSRSTSTMMMNSLITLTAARPVKREAANRAEEEVTEQQVNVAPHARLISPLKAVNPLTHDIEVVNTCLLHFHHLMSPFTVPSLHASSACLRFPTLTHEIEVVKPPACCIATTPCLPPLPPHCFPPLPSASLLSPPLTHDIEVINPCLLRPEQHQHGDKAGQGDADGKQRHAVALEAEGPDMAPRRIAWIAQSSMGEQQGSLRRYVGEQRACESPFMLGVCKKHRRAAGWYVRALREQQAREPFPLL